MIKLTTQSMNKSEELLESKDLREQLVDRTEVLDKVKNLLMLPGTEWMAVPQIAEFYNVEVKAIQKVAQRNRDELISDGMQNLKRKTAEEILNRQEVSLEIKSYTLTYTSPTGLQVNISNRGILVFPKRAILRVGMLLRDSEVAKEVRTQLLNIVEKVPDEVKTEAIDEELSLQLDVVKALSNGDNVGVLEAYTKLMAFKNQHIEKLEAKNQVLTKKYNKVTTKQAIRKAVNALAYKSKTPQGVVWNKLYAELWYKHGINIKKRKGNGTLIDKLTEPEQKDLLAIAYLECEDNKINLDEELKIISR